MLQAAAALVTLSTLLKEVVPAGPTSAVCNDGTQYAYYLEMGTATDKWILFQQGGSYCWNKATCDYRRSHDSTQMSAKQLPPSLNLADGILSDSLSENPYFATWNKIMLPYCTSDAFSGTVASSSWDSSLSFLGSRVVPSVIADLKAKHGLVDHSSTTFVYSGASAGAVGMYPNIDVLSSSLLPASHVVAVIDSGWFMDSSPLVAPNCSYQPLTCTVEHNLQMGDSAWNPSLDADCVAAKSAGERWQCMMGHYVEPYLSTSIFVFEWQYDLAQLYHDGIEENPSSSATELAYAQVSRANLTQTFEAAQNHHRFFSPACYQHVVLNNKHPTWLQVTVNNVNLADALRDFVSGNLTSTILVDACTKPDCNPTCPPPQHIG